MIPVARTFQKIIFYALFTCISGVSFSQYTIIPDPKFEARLIQLGIDTDGENGKVLTSAILNITNLNISNAQISDLTGIEGFTSLTTLTCRNNKLTELDLSNNPMLSTLQCDRNQLTSLETVNNPNLTSLSCPENLLETLQLFENTELVNLNCSYNKISVLSLSNNLKLVEVVCSNNQIHNLNFNKNLSITTIDCASNNLSTLDISYNTSLVELLCSNNNLTSLTVGDGLKLSFLDCSFNKFENLNLSLINTIQYLFCDGNTSLINICVADQSYAESNPNFKKDEGATWVETCVVTKNNQQVYSQKEMTIFPNPTQGNFRISNEAKGDLIVLDLYRRVILKTDINEANSLISIENIAKGNYIVVFTSENTSFTSSLIVD